MAPFTILLIAGAVLGAVLYRSLFLGGATGTLQAGGVFEGVRRQKEVCLNVPKVNHFYKHTVGQA